MIYPPGKGMSKVRQKRMHAFADFIFSTGMQRDGVNGVIEMTDAARYKIKIQLQSLVQELAMVEELLDACEVVSNRAAEAAAQEWGEGRTAH